MEQDYSVIGKPLPRVDGAEKATGQGKFSVDISLPGMLHAKLLRSPHPHARILNIDTSRARRLAGVKAVITGQDTAGIRYAFVDTPRYPADETPLAVDKVRYIGDEVAAVAAVDEDTAQEALELIRVEYEPLPAVFEVEEALRPEAPIIHEEEMEGTSAWEDWGARRTASSQPDYKQLGLNNLSGRTFVSQGDIEEGFRQADYVREDRFVTRATAHAALEPHAAVASFEPSGKLNIWLSSMSIFYKRFILAKALGLPLGKVRIWKTYVGGAFGGKLDLFPYEFCAAFLSRQTGKPVKMELSREEVFTTTRQRHPTIITVKTGVKRDGTIVAQDVRFIVDNGAYRGSGAVVIFLGHAFNAPILRIPHYRYEGLSVYTNNPVRGPQRAHGTPQMRFAIDSQIDMIARDLGLDPVDILLKNARQVGDILPNGDRLDSCGLGECIQRAAEATAWHKTWGLPPAKKKRGVGISVCAMFSGAPFYPFASAALVKMGDDGRATLYAGHTEMGQGGDTVLSQIAAQELGLELGDVQLVSGDTELCPVDMGNFLSGGAYVTGNAVRLAAQDARRQLFEVAADMLEAKAEDLEAANRSIYVKGSPDRAVPIARVVATSVQRHGGNPIIGRGYRKIVPEADNYPSLAKAKGRFTNAYSFAAQVAEVEVDTETGEVRLLRATTFHDCGYPLNPQIVEGQLDGCVSMGAGQVLGEDILLREGLLLNPSFLDYKLPVSLESIPGTHGVVNTRDPGGPYGAKEVGEGAIAGILAAMANAIYDAVGVRITSLPITPEKVLGGLRRQGS
jgi:4-hydroxybenzoyl-CoA reductase subunit alpha